MRIIGVIQARLSSTRLPGKVMMKIDEDITILKRVQAQVLKSKLINNVVVVSDDKELNTEMLNGVSFFYNSDIPTSDVLKRTYEGVKSFDPDIIVRITSDCPLIIPELIDIMIITAIKKDVPYMGIRGLEGIFGEVFSFKALETADKVAITGYEREHVTPYIKSMVKSIETKGIYLDDYKFSVDTINNLNNISELIKLLKKGKTL